MVGGDDLWECIGLGAVDLVTPGADDGCVGQLGLRRCWVFSVLALRPVAGFAGNVGMAAELFLIDDVGVASLAGVMPGKNRRAGSNLADSITAIVAVLSEALGDNGLAQQDEDYQQDGDDNREPNEMFDVLEH